VAVEVISSESASSPEKRGKINFRVMRPATNRLSIELCETFITTQDEFISLLKTGKFRALIQGELSIEIIDLFLPKKEKIAL
jgi:hypothetical protein